VRGIYQLATVSDKADKIIHPNVAQFNYLDFRPAPDIAEAGYQATIEVMDDLLVQFKAAGFCLD
jgi:predicted acylesterase/phospholipase RssA